MKKIAIYPFSQPFDKILELLNWNIEIDYELMLITNSIRRHLSCYNNNQRNKVFSATEFESGKINYDVLWIVDSEEDIDFEDELIPIINSSLEQQKTVIVTRRLGPKERAILGDIEDDKLIVKKSTSIQQSVLYDIHTPVVVVAGICPGLDNLKVGINLMKAMREMGYIVSLIGDSGDLALCGCNYIDDALYDECMNVRKKVHLFNTILHNVEVNEKPDAIIIVVSNDYHIRINVEADNYGENIYALSKSCDIDYMIVNTSYDYHKYCLNNSIDGYCDITSLSLTNIDALNICNMKLLVEETEMMGSPQWLHLDKSICHCLIDTSSSPIVVFEGMDVVAQDIEDKLSMYSEAPRW